jgi:hypothetical protein
VASWWMPIPIALSLHWINFMRLVLPEATEAGALYSFWAALCLLTGAVVVGVAVTGGSMAWPAALAAGAVGGGALFLAGLSAPTLLRRLYRAWNGAARRYGRLAARAVTAVWYWTVFWTASAAGERGRLAAVPAAWQGRGTLAPEAFGRLGRGGEAGEGGDDVGGILDFARWAVGSRRSWAVTLVPLLWSLRVLDTRRDRLGESANVYTLY